MIEIVGIDEINSGDKILIPGINEDELIIVTVGEKTEDNEIIPIELGGLDYTPDDYSQIVRLSTTNVRNLVA